MLFKTFLFLGVTSISVGANFINLNPSSTETLKEYDMQFSKHGTNFTQKVKLDKDNGLIIYEVPAHGNRVATKFVYDNKAVS